MAGSPQPAFLVGSPVPKPVHFQALGHQRLLVGAVAAGDSDAGVGMAALVTFAAVCGLAATWRRMMRRTLVARGPTGGCWYKYSYRAKPGDKYRYRTSTDRFEPEWGTWPPVAEGRLIKYGELLIKGTPQGPANYAKMKASRGAKAAEPVGALLLDCDGTLVETERDGHRIAFNKAFKEKGFDCEWDVKIYGELLTTGGGKERMTRYFKDYNAAAWPHPDPPAKDHPAIQELHELKTKLFMEIVRSAALPLREGIEELLSAAHDAGWTMAVCSTSNEESVKAVVQTMLPRYAKRMRIFAGDVVKAKKPDPEIYLMASRELGLAPMKCIVVEDTNIGARAGKAAGMQVVVTKSVYSEEEDFSQADIVVGSAGALDFEADIAPLLPTLQLA